MGAPNMAGKSPDFQMDASEDHLENDMNMGNISNWHQV